MHAYKPKMEITMPARPVDNPYLYAYSLGKVPR